MYLKCYLKSLPKVYSNYLKCVMYCFEMSLLFVIIFFFKMEIIEFLKKVVKKVF